MTAGGLVEILGMVGRKSIPLDTPAIVKGVCLFPLVSMVQPNIKISWVQLTIQSPLKTLQAPTVFPPNKLVCPSTSCAHPTNIDRCAQSIHRMPTTHFFFALNQENSSKTLSVEYNCSESVQNQHAPSESPRILHFPSRLQTEVESAQ